MISVIPIIYGFIIAFIDSIILSLLKAYQLGWFRHSFIIPLSMIIFSFQPILFLESLKHSSLIVMNLLWDVSSVFLITIFGILYFKEKLTNLKIIGLILSVISIILLSIDGNN